MQECGLDDAGPLLFQAFMLLTRVQLRRLMFTAVLSVFMVEPLYALDLIESYHLGLVNDPAVLAAEANRNAAQKFKPIGLAKLLPSIVLNLDGSGLRADTGKSPYVGQSNTDYSFGQANFNALLTQPLFRYDAWVTYWQADYQLAQAQAQLEAEYQILAVRVAKAYFDVLYAEDIVEFTTIQHRSLDQEAAQVQERLNLGFATLIDLNETTSRRDKVSADLILADQKLNDAREALREIIGSYDASLVRVPDALPLAKPEPDNIELWSDVAQQSNLMIIAASSAAEVAKHAIDMNYAGHLPTLDLQAQQYLTANDRPTGAYQLSQQSIGINLSVPIYQGGGVSAKVDQSRDQYEKSVHELDKQRRTVQRQVKDAFRAVLSSMGRIEALQSAVISAQSALEASQVGYQVGNSTILNVLVQQSLYFQYWADYARVRYDYLVSSLQLKQAAGTLMISDVDAINRLILGRTTGRKDKHITVPKLTVPQPDFSGEPLLVGPAGARVK